MNQLLKKCAGTQKPKSAKKAQHCTAQGFSLIEVSIAMALLAIVAVGSTSVITGMLRLNRESRYRMNASTQAREILDTINGLAVVANDQTQLYGLLNSPASPVGSSRTDINSSLCPACSASGCGACELSAGTGMTQKVTIGAFSNNIHPVRVDISWLRQGRTNTFTFRSALALP